MHSGRDPRATAGKRQLLQFRGLSIDIDARRVVCDGVERILSKSEFDLLAELARHEGTVLSPEHLFCALWGSDWVGDGHALEVQISRLRAKLGESSRAQRFIITVRGAGYRFDGPPHGPIVTLTYDSALRVTNIDPKDRPFLGWDPADIIGTFFLPAAGPVSEMSQEQAIGIMRSVFSSDSHVYRQTYETRCADGSTKMCSATTEFLRNADGDFDGVIFSLHEL